MRPAPALAAPDVLVPKVEFTPGEVIAHGWAPQGSANLVEDLYANAPGNEVWSA